MKTNEDKCKKKNKRQINSEMDIENTYQVHVNLSEQQKGKIIKMNTINKKSVIKVAHIKRKNWM